MIILVNEGNKASRVLSRNEQEMVVYWMGRVVVDYDEDLAPYTEGQALALEDVLALYLGVDGKL